MVDDLPIPASERSSERDLIKRITAIFQNGNGNPPFLGIGDDAACIQLGDRTLIVTTDAMSENFHFRIGQIPWVDIGWKAVVSNQSDIAAMGGVPLYAVTTIGIPKTVTAEEVESLYTGMMGALEEFGGVCIGGDTVTSDSLFVSVTLIGEAGLDKEGNPLIFRRNRALPDDIVAVTGPLGGAAGGLAAIEQSITLDASGPLRTFHLHPEPRVYEGGLLAKLGVVCAMDISDGLAGDLEKIATASGLSAVIQADDVPMPNELVDLFPNDALTMALSGGEDYELLFTASAPTMDRALKRLPNARAIGRMTKHLATKDRVTIISGSGETMKIERMGWDSLSG